MEEKKYYKYIFVVLLYRNMEDVLEFLESLHKTVNDYHIILVDSFFNQETNERARKIAESTPYCSFLTVENRGYGAGNNAGIAYARTNFVYDYIIVSNPDIVINHFDEQVLLNPSKEILYAPKIISRDHKRQNPNWAVHSDTLEYLQYLACKKENILLDYTVIAILKIMRIVVGVISDIFHIKRLSIGNAHGSFFILSRAAVERLSPLFDKRMFLFYEEVYLGSKAYKNHVPIYYTPSILVFHKEDGSMRIANLNTRKEAHKSVVFYYEHKKQI